MRKLFRWLGYGAAGVVAVGLVGLGGLYAASSHMLGQVHDPVPERLAAPSPAILKTGLRLLNTHGCIDCHGEGLRGRKMFDQPGIATIYAPNLTLIAAKASDQQLAQGIRQGIGHDRRPLFVMPSTSFSSFTDEETRALIQAIRAQPKGGEEQPANSLGPLARLGLIQGKFPLMPDAVRAYRARPAWNGGPALAAGRHTAMTICADCHGSDLSGKEFEPGVMAPTLDTAGAYDLPAFTRLMRTGVPPGGRDLKTMDDVSRKSFSHFTDREIADLFAYLQARATQQEP